MGTTVGGSRALAFGGALAVCSPSDDPQTHRAETASVGVDSVTRDSETSGKGDEKSPGDRSLSQRIRTTPAPPGGWCAWCQDKPSAGQLVLVDDTGVPIRHPQAPPGGWQLCGWCGWRFDKSESTTLPGTYVYDPVEGA